MEPRPFPCRVFHLGLWYPVGTIGLFKVTETWLAPDLKITILIKSTSPELGEKTQKLTNISRAEPPADLFQPPPDYTLIDEPGDFTIKWGPQP